MQIKLINVTCNRVYVNKANFIECEFKNIIIRKWEEGVW